MKQKVFNLIILDESGSMTDIEKEALVGVNETIQAIKSAELKHESQEHFLSMVTFNSEGTKAMFEQECVARERFYDRVEKNCPNIAMSDDYLKKDNVIARFLKKEK